jgi:DNA-binding winged helix-turn-helix (wHTH) protein
MDALSPSDIFLFEDFRLDRRGLFRRDQAGAFVPIKIGSRALDILRVLIDRPGELVAKDEIVAAVWPGTVVEDGNLTMQISTLRRLLDREATEGSCIQTVTGRGYRFVAPVMQEMPAVSIADSTHLPDVPDGEDSLGNPPAASERSSGGRTSFRLWHLGVACLTALAVMASVAVFGWDHRWFSAAGVPRLSIVVLPFANLSNDPEQEYFADARSPTI